MAEARGVPRGNYDDPVHDVISMTKSVPSTPMTRGPPCPKTLIGSRNLHQSGFTLAGIVGCPLLTLASQQLCYTGSGRRTDMTRTKLLIFQELRLTTTYLVAPPRGLQLPLVADPTSHHYRKRGVEPFVFHLSTTTDSTTFLFQPSLTHLGLKWKNAQMVLKFNVLLSESK